MVQSDETKKNSGRFTMSDLSSEERRRLYDDFRDEYFLKYPLLKMGDEDEFFGIIKDPNKMSLRWRVYNLFLK